MESGGAGAGAGNERLIAFRVADNGIGISQENLQSLFAAFKQADNTAGGHFGGTGLGLALARRFCRMMGGDVSVESEPDKGSVFTIRLPLRQGCAEVLSAPARNGQTVGLPANGATVLIVEDDPAARHLIEHVVKREGFDVASATTARRGCGWPTNFTRC